MMTGVLMAGAAILLLGYIARRRSRMRGEEDAA